jgi:hypothetical protein
MNRTVLFLASLLLGVSAQAQLLIQPTVAAFSSQNPYGINRFASYTRDGSGLTAGPSGILGAADTTCNGTASPGMWTTRGNTGAPNDTAPYITYDLGAVHTLQTTRIWNYNETSFTMIGVQQIVLSTSVDNTNFTTLANLTVAQAGGGPAEMAQDFATPATGVRYVRLQILTNYDGAIYWSSLTGTNYGGADGRYLTGLSEVRFEVATAVPIIWQQPVSQTQPAGTPVSLTVTASDSGFPPLTHRWRKNGVNLTDGGNLSGATTSNLLLSAVSLADQGYYDVVVSNSQTAVTSRVANVFIGGALISPSIAAFSSEYNQGGIQRLVANLVNGAGMSGPGYYYDTHGRAEEQVWHHGPGDSSPWVTFDLGGYYDLLIARYWNLNQESGTANGARNVRLSVSADNATFTVLTTNLLARAGGTTAEPAQDFPITAASVRYVKIEPLDGYGGGWNGLSSVRFEGNPVATPLPNIFVQPVSSTNLPGDTVVFSVLADANGNPPLTYRWRRNGVSLTDGGNRSGATTDTLTVTGVTGADTGSYTVLVSNSVAGLSSVQAYLQVIVPPEISLSSRSGGLLITPAVSGISSEFGPGRWATNVVDPGGLSGPGYYTDTKPNAAFGWGPELTDAAPSITFDLGVTGDLLITRIWNFNSPGYPGAGAKDVRISVSADSVNFSVLGTNTLVIAGGTPNEPSQDFATAAAAVRYVRLEPLSGYGGAERALGGVRFVLADAQRPALVNAVLMGIPTLRYQLLYTDSLTAPLTWQTLEIPTLPASPYTLPIQDGLIPTNAPQRFYRASVVWP